MRGYLDQKHHVSVKHWAVSKVTNNLGDWDERLVVPEGMHWIVIPPFGTCFSPDVEWFPTGSRAHAYLQSMKNDLDLNPIGAQAK